MVTVGGPKRRDVIRTELPLAPEMPPPIKSDPDLEEQRPFAAPDRAPVRRLDHPFSQVA
jgi:hypothetical protein